MIKIKRKNIHVNSVLFVCLALMLALCNRPGNNNLPNPYPQAEAYASTQQEFRHFLPTISKPCVGNCYYVDSINGSDANSGISEAEPWQTLAPVNSRKFIPGDIIKFKRGSSWTGGLVIKNSGVEGNPIIYQAYGNEERPVFHNPGSPGSLTKSVVIDADWIIVEGFLVSDANQAGIYISPQAEHNIVKDNEATNVGIGVAIYGKYNLVTRNNIHDLHMVVNTPGGNDDHGAVGVVLNYASSNVISYNRLVNCKAPSYDYGTDGGAVEWWGTADGNYVHHNWASGDNGFLEVSGGTAWDNRVAYNISVNNGDFSVLHLGDPFGSDVRNFRVENNTIVETSNPGWVIFVFDGSPSIDTFLLSNNILYVEGFQYISNESTFLHEYNLFYLGGETELGFTLSQGEINADPQFIDRVGGNFHLLPASPAIDAGTGLGYTLDFEDNTVPYGKAPDIGAFEYQGFR